MQLANDVYCVFNPNRICKAEDQIYPDRLTQLISQHYYPGHHLSSGSIHAEELR
jgi:hypothetical protein